jgi:hypothetical protein
MDISYQPVSHELDLKLETSPYTLFCDVSICIYIYMYYIL